MKIKIENVKVRAMWSIAILAGFYFCLQMITDVTVAKMAALFGQAIPAGSILYAVTFTWRDLVHKRLGAAWTRIIIVLAAVFNIVMAAWFIITINLPPASFWPNQEAYALTLGIMPRVVIASIVVECIAQLVDTQIYAWIEPWTTGKRQWLRVVLSNTVSGPLDGLLFGVLAFAGTMPMDGLKSIILGGMTFKLVIGYVLTPMIYAIPEGRLEFELEDSS